MFKNNPKTDPKMDDGKRLDSPSLDVVSGKCGVSKRGGSSRGERALYRGPGGGGGFMLGGVWASLFQYFPIFRQGLEKYRKK